MDLLKTAQVKDPDGNAVDITMGYGRTGNIVNNSRLGSYTYSSSRPNAVRAAGSNTYNYDANGNMTTRITGARSQSMDFDHENRLASITEGANRNEYLYDYTGARVKKVSLVSGATSTTVYIGGIYEQKDGVNIKHIFAGGRRVASRKGSSTFYFHPDHLGSLSVVTNAAGESKQTATYYPFGETRDSTGPEDFDYKFTGQENDPETGLYYYGARYYDPEIGRFISPDSIVQAPADPQTLNRYSYCRNNPMVYTDPSGNCYGIFGFLAILALGAGAGAAIAAIQGGDIGMGALTGAIAAGAFLGAGQGIAALGLVQTTAQGVAYVSTEAFVGAVGIHAATGAAVGAINAGITGGDVGLAAITGGISGGMGKFLGSYIPHFGDKLADFGLQLSGHTLIGGVTGGIAAEIYGGDFGQGFSQGAMTAGYGFLFNQMGGRLLDPAMRFVERYGSRAFQWVRGLFYRGAAGGTNIDPNKLNHIFGQPKHNLGGLVAEFGSQEAAYNAMQTAVQSLNVSGVFQETVQVGSYSVVMRGAVVDGVAKIGTAWIP